MRLGENRVDASLLSEEERSKLNLLLAFVERSEQPCLKGANGEEIQLPEPIFRVLVKVIQEMKHGKAVLLVPEEETFTTQAAANYLGMSRQYFVTLIESGRIPFHRVGSHRRVYYKDLRQFARERDKARRSGLGNLFKRLNEEGHYDTEYTGGNAE